MRRNKNRESAPSFSFQWHITDQCDQRCRHCYIFSGNASAALCVMPWEQMPAVVEACQALCDAMGRRPCFYLTGGDPLLHPDFWRLMKLLKSEGLPVAILGNPFHLTPGVCRRLKRLGCFSYQMSLDGLEDTHDWFRKPGSFRETLEKIPMLNRAGIESAIMTTVSGVNYRQVPDIARAAAAAGARVYAFARFCPADGQKDIGISPEAYRQLLYDCADCFRALKAEGCKTWFAKKDHLWTLYDYETGAFVPPEDAEPGVVYGGCNCGANHLTLLPNGDVYACRRVPGSRVGNVLRQSLTEIWVQGMAPYRQYARFEKCADCLLMPWCRGCPAVAAGTQGSFYAPDPQCWK